MILSDISVKRPVLASVFGLLLVAFGLIAFERLTLREYPDIDKPIVSIDVTYTGADAAVIESRITQVIEDRIAGVEGIESIQSSSQDGRAQISVEFKTGRNIDDAANDIRDRVASVRDDLPADAEAPEVSKVDSSDDVVIWLNLVSDRMKVEELTDYANRYLVDQFSVLEGVARIRVGGGRDYALRVWLDRDAMAARGLTVAEIETALRQENVELPAGTLESSTRVFTGRIERVFKTAEDFSQMVVARQDDTLVRLADVARVEKSTVEDRSLFRGNGQAMVGLGIIKQSTANVMDVARAAKAKAQELAARNALPEGMELRESYDSSVFVERAIAEVYMTLAFTIVCVVAVLLLFVGSWRATLVPAMTVPVSIIASCIVLYALGFSVNLLTLLAVVLAIGLVVDDAIVVLENIVRRMQEYGESPLLAAFNGTREVGFAVVATTLVLVAVFVPLAFLEGDLGRLFSEFAITMAAAVALSSVVALTLCPMLASLLLKPRTQPGPMAQRLERQLTRLSQGYAVWLEGAMSRPILLGGALVACVAMAYGAFKALPSEFAPQEDRGAFFVMINGPEGASYAYMEDYMNVVEARLMPYVERGELTRLLVRAPRGFGAGAAFNTGMVIAVMNDWGSRRPIQQVVNDIRVKLADLPGVTAFPVVRQAFGGGNTKPVQVVLGAPTYEKAAQWRDTLVAALREQAPYLMDLDWDYKETKPQLKMVIDYTRAADMGVRVRDIGVAVQTLLGSRTITTYLDDGEEYDVIVEGDRARQRTVADIANIYVRGGQGQLVPLQNLVSFKEQAAPTNLNRFNRQRAITLEAGLAEGATLGQALPEIARIAAQVVPEARLDYKGASRDFMKAGSDVGFVFVLGLLVVFLVLAAQFESYVHPMVIMLTVPMALVGGLLGLVMMGATLNIYSQVGLVMLVGLATKNGILIVEFANQLRDGGVAFDAAIRQAARLRFRPIVMTSLTTVVGAIPLVLASGAGSEARQVIGIVIFFGVLSATLFTLFIIPWAYSVLARRTGSPLAVTQRLEAEMVAAERE